MRDGVLRLGGGLRGDVCVRVMRDDRRSLSRLRDLLTSSDLHAARRLRHAGGRRAFLINCALLRELVSEMTGQAPGRVRLRLRRQRRPLHLGAGVRRLALSTSHAGGWVAVAAVRGAGAGRRIGLDLEARRRRLGAGLQQRMPWRDQIAERGIEPDDEGTDITAWCLTEAALKADARGLSALRRLRSQGASPRSGGVMRIEDRTPGRITTRRLSGLPDGLRGALATASFLGPVRAADTPEDQEPSR